MANSDTTPGAVRARASTVKTVGPSLSPEHYLRILVHRKWLVIGTFLVISAATAIYSYRLPDIFTSDTLILVDPQKVPESYVKSTVTGDVRNRLGTLSQQILSTTRLQKIIDNLNLYPQERKTLAREDVTAMMRSQISVKVVGDFGGGSDLQAFRIGFSGREPRLVAQVANELASLFIDENLKAREQQATGTTEFLQNQLQETRKALEAQEAKLKDFKLKHLGEMPEQQAADLQILGQLQSQLQLESDALARAEQQKSMIQTMMAASSGGGSGRQCATKVIRSGGNEISWDAGGERGKGATCGLVGKRLYRNTSSCQKGQGANRGRRSGYAKGLLQRSQRRPFRLRLAASPVPVPAPPQSAKKVPPPFINSTNPVLQSQLKQLDAEIAKHKQEQQRVSKQIAGYQSKLEAIPVREQQITELVRDYEISKVHYSQLLNNLQSAETATQLEIRQKGEKFSVLDPAQPPEKPSSPKRAFINAGGGLAGLCLGILLALITELMGMSITTPEQITESSGIPVLEVIPVIQTYVDRKVRRRRLTWVTVCGIVAAILVSCAALHSLLPQLRLFGGEKHLVPGILQPKAVSVSPVAGPILHLHDGAASGGAIGADLQRLYAARVDHAGGGGGNGQNHSTVLSLGATRKAAVCRRTVHQPYIDAGRVLRPPDDEVWG